MYSQSIPPHQDSDILSIGVYIITLIAGWISLTDIEQIMRVFALFVTICGGLTSIAINWPSIKEKYFKK